MVSFYVCYTELYEVCHPPVQMSMKLSKSKFLCARFYLIVTRNNVKIN